MHGAFIAGHHIYLIYIHAFRQSPPREAILSSLRVGIEYLVCRYVLHISDTGFYLVKGTSKAGEWGFFFLVTYLGTSRYPLLLRLEEECNGKGKGDRCGRYTLARSPLELGE